MTNKFFALSLTLLFGWTGVGQVTGDDLAAPQRVDDDQMPLVFDCDFEKGASQWQPTDETAWKIDSSLTKDAVYSQFKKRSKYQPPFRSPFNMSLVKDLAVESFQIDVDVLSTHKDYNHRDACLFFGYQSPSQFYYVHLGKKTDPHANQIFIVNKAARTKISLTTTPGTDWDDQWHHVRIKRDTRSGTIEIYFDDLKKPVMTAKDKTFLWGQVGLGSFDDTTAWNNFKLRGKKKVVKK